MTDDTYLWEPMWYAAMYQTHPEDIRAKIKAFRDAIDARHEEMGTEETMIASAKRLTEPSRFFRSDMRPRKEIRRKFLTDCSAFSARKSTQ